MTTQIDALNLPRLDAATGAALKEKLQEAEQTGLHPGEFDPSLTKYLLPTENASVFGYSVTFLAVALIALIGAGTAAWLVRKPKPDPRADPLEPAQEDAAQDGSARDDGDRADRDQVGHTSAGHNSEEQPAAEDRGRPGPLSRRTRPQ